MENIPAEENEFPVWARQQEQRKLRDIEWLGVIWAPALGLLMLIYFVSGDSFVWGGWLPDVLDHWLNFILCFCIVTSVAFGIGHSIDTARLESGEALDSQKFSQWRIYLGVAASVLMAYSLVSASDFWFSPSSSSGNDPRFSTCRAATEQGYGPYASDFDAEYFWYRDSDNDGLVCE